MRASLLDAYVEEQVVAALQQEDGLLAQAVVASEQIENAARDQAEAEHELDLFVDNPRLLSNLGEQKFHEGAEVRHRALDEARAALAPARSQSSLAEELGDGDLLRAWPKPDDPGTPAADARAARPRGRNPRRPPGRQARPVGERAEILLRGGLLLEPPTDVQVV